MCTIIVPIHTDFRHIRRWNAELPSDAGLAGELIGGVADGTRPLRLLEALTQKPIGSRYHDQPGDNRVKRIENAHM